MDDGFDFDVALKPKTDPPIEAEIVEQNLPALSAISAQPAKAKLLQYDTLVKLWESRAAEIITITDDAINKKAAEYALEAIRVLKIIDDLEEYYKRPHLAYTAEVRSFAKALKDPLERIISNMRRLQSQYRSLLENEAKKRKAAKDKVQREMQAELAAEAEEAAKKGEVYTPVNLPAPPKEDVPKVVHTSVGSSSQKKVIRIEVLDLDKVNPKYLTRTVDEKAVKDDFKAGIRFDPETSGLNVTEDYDTRYRL